MQTIKFPLSTVHSERYKIKGYGLVLLQAPWDIEAYVVFDGKSDQLATLNISKIVQIPEGFEYFDLANIKAYDGKYMYVAVLESLEEVASYREILQPKFITDYIDVVQSVIDGAAWGYMDVFSLGTRLVMIENPSDSPNKIYITNVEFRTDSTHLEIELYKDANKLGPTTITPINLNIGYYGSRHFHIYFGDDTEILGGTLIGKNFVDSSNKFTDSIQSSMYFVINPGHNLTWKFINTDSSTRYLGVKFYIIEPSQTY